MQESPVSKEQYNTLTTLCSKCHSDVRVLHYYSKRKTKHCRRQYICECGHMGLWSEALIKRWENTLARCWDKANQNVLSWKGANETAMKICPVINPMHENFMVFADKIGYLPNLVEFLTDVMNIKAWSYFTKREQKLLLDSQHLPHIVFKSVDTAGKIVGLRFKNAKYTRPRMIPHITFCREARVLLNDVDGPVIRSTTKNINSLTDDIIEGKKQFRL